MYCTVSLCTISTRLQTGGEGGPAPQRHLLPPLPPPRQPCFQLPLASPAALESLAINLNLATAVLETSAPRLLQQLGAAPRCQPLDRALSTAARAFPTAATAAHGGWGGTGIVRSSVSSTRSSGSSRGGRDRIGRPGAGGCEEGRWGVESWVPKEPVQGSEEGKGFEWVEGVQKGARGLRAVCRVAN